MAPKTLFEPFRIKVVEPIRISSPLERQNWLKEAGFNVFNLRSEQVMIDLLTDSGTCAMSHDQWAALINGDESYAGSKSFFELEQVAKEIFQKEFIIPVHQGRAGEHLVFSTLVQRGDVIPSNSHFDTTAANIEDNGGIALNLPCPEGTDPYSDFPFKGNIDLTRLESTLREEKARIPFVMCTVTNNTRGGQPVSLENLRAIKALCEKNSKPFVMDACRFAENSYFIKTRESGFGSRSVLSIAQEMCRLADLIIFSAKKDGLANIGGLVCLGSHELSEKLKNRLIITEGFATYGGMAGRDLSAIAQGLREVLEESYLSYRVRTIEWTVERLAKAGIPVITPAGGHAVYLIASDFLPQIAAHELPGITLVCELYLRGGIRAVELGNVAFGKRAPDGSHIAPSLDLVRLAMPRRVYTEAHVGYVVEVIVETFADRARLKGFQFDYEAPVMRHFRSTYKRLFP